MASPREQAVSAAAGVGREPPRRPTLQYAVPQVHSHAAVQALRIAGGSVGERENYSRLRQLQEPFESQEAIRPHDGGQRAEPVVFTFQPIADELQAGRGRWPRALADF